MIKFRPVFVATAVLVGCQSSGVVQTSPGTYIVSKTSAAGGFANMGKVRVELIREANEFARQQGGVALETDYQESRPAVGLPSASYSFAVLSPGQYERSLAAREKDWAALSPAQRESVRQSDIARRAIAREAALDRSAYNARTSVMAMPQQHNVNVNHSGDVLLHHGGSVRHSLEHSGTIYHRQR